ncbi:metallophosphoesterase [Ectobacillus antri]|uniref:Phosphoesterase n=1 Tax=Ectobacillus antri TaxID=2486280 RepID=A0ABT6H309_9BACI|nr:metallophosphoesterase [Ectobacillus antri]MDG4655336.1 metallophosphoesterase [Ectobacillus antri]MDG5753094.1 metallophosphoesterase [Ectobacillus antri]
MMNCKVLIVSDSHGMTGELQELYNRHAVDVYIHCGDSELPAAHPALAGYSVVKGNCDFESAYPTNYVEKVNGLSIFVTHGHLYNVKMTLQKIWYKAKEAGAQVACFGHSHVMGAELIEDVLLINPGSILLPRGRRERTYALLDVQNKQATVIFYELSGKEVAKESFVLQ